MSYDIEMLRLPETGDRLAQARAAHKAEQIPPSPDEDEKRARLVADLIALEPSLYSAPYDKGASYGCVVTTDDSACHLPYIEIGIGRALVQLSFSADADVAFPELERVIEVFERHGYVAYDPQTDSLLVSSPGFIQSRSSFASTRDGVVAQMQDRGETVVGIPHQRGAFWKIVGAAIFLAVTTSLIVLQQHRASQTPESVKKELRALQNRFEATRARPPGSPAGTDARKSGARGSP